MLFFHCSFCFLLWCVLFGRWRFVCFHRNSQTKESNEWMNTNNDSLIPCLAVQFLSSKNVHFFCDCSRRIPFLFVITSTDRDRQTWQFLLLNCYSHFHIFVHSSQSLRAIKMAILNYVLFNCLRLFFNSHLHILHFNFRLRTHNKLNTHADGSLLYKTGWRGRYVADMPFHRQFVYSIQTQMSWNWIEIWSAMSLSVVLFNGCSAGCFFLLFGDKGRSKTDKCYCDYCCWLALLSLCLDVTKQTLSVDEHYIKPNTIVVGQLNSEALECWEEPRKLMVIIDDSVLLFIAPPSPLFCPIICFVVLNFKVAQWRQVGRVESRQAKCPNWIALLQSLAKLNNGGIWLASDGSVHF